MFFSGKMIRIIKVCLRGKMMIIGHHHLDPMFPIELLLSEDSEEILNLLHDVRESL